MNTGETNNPQSCRDLSFGEKLVGIDFNPSADPIVTRVKQICAELADIVYQNNYNVETTKQRAWLEQHTYGEILNAQMNVVKAVTFKY